MLCVCVCVCVCGLVAVVQMYQKWSSLVLHFPLSSSSPIRNRTPKIQLGSLGSAVSSPVKSGVEQQPNSNLVHYIFKIRYLVAKTLVIFLRINGPNLVQFESVITFWLGIGGGLGPFCLCAANMMIYCEIVGNFVDWLPEQVVWNV